MYDFFITFYITHFKSRRWETGNGDPPVPCHPRSNPGVDLL